MNYKNPLAFGDSLLVMVIGMVIVFFGLAVLIGLIKLLITATDRMKSGSKKQQAAAPASPARIPETREAPAPAGEAADDSHELIAVITAAIACMLDDNQRFIVRHVRRISQ